MNTYQESLLSVTEETLADLAAEQAKRNSDENCAEFNFYFSQGVKLAAQSQLDQVTSECLLVQDMNEQGVACESLTINLKNTVKRSEKITLATIKNTQTVAKNVQVAANSVARLAADIGSALNIVFAADYGTDIAKMTQSANLLIREAAYKAELASQTAMEASTMTAEITAKQVTDTSALVNKSMQTLLKATQSQLAQLEGQKSADSLKFSETLVAEKTAQGVLFDRQSHLQAINNSYVRSNRELNYNLKVLPLSLNCISLKYMPFDQPFKAGNATSAGTELEVPKADPQHFITLVKASRRSLFNMDAANLNFGQYQEQRFINVEAMSDCNSLDLTGKLDADGDPILPSVNYVVFLYVELSLSYKKFTNDYSDLLSAPSEAFVLVSALPKITQPIQYKSKNNAVVELQFKVMNDVPDCVEFRCIFTMDNALNKGVVLIDSDDEANTPAASNSEHASDDQDAQATVRTREDASSNGDLIPAKHYGIHLTTAIAEHVSIANYLVAKPSGANSYKVKVDADITDNYGYKIIPGKSYSIAILTTQIAETLHQPYTSTLSIPPIVANTDLTPNTAEKPNKSKGKKS